MTTTAQFLFDFGSPNAYLVHRAIPEVEARGHVRFDYVPVLLGGLFKMANNRSPMEAFGDIPNKLAYERKEMQRFIERHGLTRFRMNPHFPVNTLKIMRGACAARRMNQLPAYVEAMFTAMWEEGRDMADDAEIAAVAQAAGLDVERLQSLMQDAEVKAELLTLTQQAHDRGAFGSPSFFIGDELWFGKERLRDLEDHAQRQG
jgi:2-hydroxychromene-2-carboxylate isomerase